MNKSIAVVLLLAFGVACNGETPTGTEELSPSLGPAGNSGCYTVDFAVDYPVTGFVPPFTWEGVVSGDLEGAAVMVFDLDSPDHSTRFTNAASATITWDLSGGMIPELVGRTFQTRMRTLNVFPNDKDPLIARNNGRDRALTGVSKVNLTWHGTTDFTQFPPSPPTTLRFYNGVICP